MLDIEAILQHFELIEQKVDTVVQSRKQLQQQNEALNDRIGQLENLVQEKTEVEKKNEELTARIRAKIEGLIERLEGITEE